MKFVSRVFLGLAGLALVAGIGSAPAEAQFYKGKTLNVIINYAPGGNTSIQGRLLMRFMPKYIPGTPRVVIRNIAGAGGKVGTNFLGIKAKRDGYTMGVFTISLLSEVLKDPALQVSHSDLIFIGGLGSQEVAYIRKDHPPGIQKPSDLFKITEPFRTGGHAPTNTKDMGTRLALDLLGVPYRHVHGFKSGAMLRKAVQQNELQYSSDSTPGFRGRVEPIMVKEGIVTPLFHTGVPTADGKGLTSHRDYPDVPSYLDLYRMKFGKDAMPSGKKWEGYLLISVMRANILRAVFLPPEAPQEAVDILRKAYNATMKDPQYLEEYKKLNKGLPSPIKGEAGQQFLLDQVKNADPELVKFLTAFADKVRE